MYRDDIKNKFEELCKLLTEKDTGLNNSNDINNEIQYIELKYILLYIFILFIEKNMKEKKKKIKS